MKVFISLLKLHGQHILINMLLMLPISLQQTLSEGCSQGFEHISMSERAEHQVIWHKLRKAGHFLIGRSTILYIYDKAILLNNLKRPSHTKCLFLVFFLSFFSFIPFIYFFPHFLSFKYSCLHFPPTTPPNPSHPYFPPLILPPFDFVHVSFIHVPENPFPFPPITPFHHPNWSLSVCS